MLWLGEVFAIEEHGYSAGDTASLLKTIADATGGISCTVDAERTGSDCARAVAADIEARSH